MMISRFPHKRNNARVKHKLKKCSCNNDTFDSSGVCSVCQVDARVLGILDKHEVKEFSKSRGILKGGTGLDILLAVEAYCN